MKIAIHMLISVSALHRLKRQDACQILDQPSLIGKTPIHFNLGHDPHQNVGNSLFRLENGKSPYHKVHYLGTN